MPTTTSTGSKGEDIACEYLIENGYKILERNYRIGRCEADLITLHSNTLALIEVKTRKFDTIQKVQQYISKQQQSRLIHVANLYVIRKKLDYDVRFDLLYVQYAGGQHEISHVIDAFRPKW